MRKGGTLTDLHADHLGSTLLETAAPVPSGDHSTHRAAEVYGAEARYGYPLVGLMYYQSRYYDPVIGAFISPDTIVPDAIVPYAMVLIDGNRYAYARGNPL